MPINPLYEFVDENLAPAEAFLQYWRNRDQSQPQGQAMQPTTGSRGILEQPAYSLQANQPQMGAAPSVPSLPRRNPAPSAIRGVNAMSPMGGEQLPEMQFNDYQEPQRNIEGLGGLGQWDELPMGGAELPEAPTPPPNILGADPGMYEEVEPRRLDEVNLPMTETKGRQQPLTTLMEPSGPIEEPQQQPAVDQRLAQTTLGRQAAAQGWDPRRMYAALAEFAGGVGNIRGKPTPSTSGKYYERMYSEEQAQRENDMKMQEMELRYAPKPEKPIDAIAQLLKKAQFESISNKTQVDKELADPNSTRSVAARDALTRYMRWQGAEKFQADPNISAMEVFKWMTALQYGIGQQGLERRTIEANIGKEVESDAKTDAAMKLQAQKDAAAMERQKAANAAAAQRQAAKPQAAAKGAVAAPAAGPVVEVPGYQRIANVPIRDTDLAKFRDNTAELETQLQQVKELQDMVSKYGSYENPYSAAGSQMQTLVTHLQLMAKNPSQYALGVLAGPDMALLESVLPSTSSWTSAVKPDASTIAGLGKFIKLMEQKQAGKARMLGFEKVAQDNVVGPRGKPLWKSGEK